MVVPKPPFLTDADIAELHDLMGQGFQTVQNFQTPQELIEIKRRESSGWVTIGTFLPISISLKNQQVIGTLEGNEQRKAGLLRLWAVDYEPHPVRVQDRFTWQNQPCRVTLVPGERFGVIDIDFELIDEDV